MKKKALASVFSLSLRANFFSSEKIMNASAEKANEKKAFEDRSNDNVTEKNYHLSLAVPKNAHRKSLGSDRERDSFGLRAARRCVELNGRKGEILESKREHRRKFE